MAESKKSDVGRRISKISVAAVFALTTLVFLLGILAGNAITSAKLNQIESMQNELKDELVSIELEDTLMQESPCIDVPLLSKKLDDLATRLTYLENEYKKDDPQILELKKPYTLLQVRHYIRMKKTIEHCKMNFTLILFFYDNTPEKISESEKQGFILDYIKLKYDNVKIYSFDSRLDMDIIKTMMNIFSVQNTPALVINGKVYTGLHYKEEIEKLLA